MRSFRLANRSVPCPCKSTVGTELTAPSISRRSIFWAIRRSLLRDYESTDQCPATRHRSLHRLLPDAKSGRHIRTLRLTACPVPDGFRPSSRSSTFKRPDGHSFPVNRYVIEQAGDPAVGALLVYSPGPRSSQRIQAKYYLVADSIRLHRSDGALIRLMSSNVRRRIRRRRPSPGHATRRSHSCRY